MSRYSFSELVDGLPDWLVTEGDEVETPTDLFGKETVALDWMKDAELGWDDGLETYYLIFSIGDSDPRFWYGTSFREIISPFVLGIVFCKIVGALPTDIRWKASFLETLKQDRLNETVLKYDETSGARAEVESHFATYDKLMSAPNADVEVSDDYMYSGVVENEIY